MFQRELARYHQSLVAVVNPLLLFCYHVNGSVQHDEVELGGNQKPELYNHVKSTRHARVHDDRVSVGLTFDAVVLNTYILLSEGWNQYMHDL